MPSTATTTTKKPNGPCAACNKEGAVLRCAPCRDAGVDVFFCNRDCQVKLWKTHKAVCKKTSNADLEREQSSASKEVKEEGKRGLQINKDTKLCGNCLKTDSDIGSKLSVCSKCNSAYYCSRECQVKDWPEHKRRCKNNCEVVKRIERSLDSTKINVHNLLQKWLAKTKMICIGQAVYYALKKKGIEQQPPAKAVIIEIEFNYNAQTFVVVEVPRAVAIADLDKRHQKNIREAFNNNKEKIAEGVEQVYTQLVVISTKELGERYESNLPIAITKSALDQMNATNVDMNKIRYRFAKVSLKSDLFHGWKSIRRCNLQKQMEQMKLGQSYTAFVQSALKFFCKKSLQNTHRILVNMNMGKVIGQISHLLEYKVVSIAEFKECTEDFQNDVIHVEDTESRSPQCTDIAIETLFVDLDICFAFEYTVYCGVNCIQNKTAKQCKKAAEKAFRKLQREVKEMPSDLLEMVSL